MHQISLTKAAAAIQRAHRTTDQDNRASRPRKVHKSRLDSRAGIPQLVSMPRTSGLRCFLTCVAVEATRAAGSAVRRLLQQPLVLLAVSSQPLTSTETLHAP